MHGTFTLTITLGNEAMQTPGNVAHALRAVAKRIDAEVGEYRIQTEVGAPIKDLNGNTVGRWAFAKDED